jgi:acetyltransferase
MSATLKRVTAPDPKLLPSLTRLLQATVDDGASVGFLAPLAEADAAEYWKSIFTGLGPERLLWIAKTNDEVVGTVQLCPSPKANGRHRAEIQKLLVHPKHRRRGISTQLMNEAESAARDLGRWLLVLDTEADSTAEFVYTKLGWIPCGGVPGFALSTLGVPTDNVYYYKELPH